jgi:hypothetical protein
MSKANKDREIARARERADLARMRFGNAVSGVLQRLTPDNLRAEAIEVVSDQLEQAKQDLLQRFRHWPVAVATIGAAGIALIFWRPARVVARYALRLASIAWSTRDLWRKKNDREAP